jgi:hypothetical protein
MCGGTVVLSQPLVPMLCTSVLSQSADTYCTPWGGSLGCANHPGNLCRLKGAVWISGPSRRWIQGRCRLLSPLITVDSFSSSSEVGILKNKLVTL